MAVFGRFETVREISQTGLGSVWTAREAGTSGQSLTASAMLRSTLAPGERYIIKVFQPLGYIPGDPQFDAEIEGFLRRAKAQRHIVERGAKRWAKVHASGRFDEGAYAVYDAHSRSVQQLVLRKVDLWRTGNIRDPGSTLRAIIQGVVEALQELARTSEGRGHGALKPSNVLLAGDGAIASSRPILTDPQPEDPARHSDYARRDLRDLGATIYQMVMQKPFREMGAWPVEDGPEWRAFGRRGGARWLDLCNRLLDPRSGATPPRLDEIAAELAQWPIERPSRKIPIAIAITVLLIGGGAGAWWATRPPPRPVLVLVGGQLDQLKDDINWIDGLAPIASDPAIAAAARTDENLARIVEPVQAYTTGDSLSRAIKYLRYERAKGDLDPTEHAVKLGVSDLWRVYEPVTRELAAWPVPSRLDAAAKSFEERGWTGAARAMADTRAEFDAILASRPSQKAVADTARSSDVRPAEAIRSVLDASRAAAEIESAWKPLTDRAAELGGVEDAVLKLYGRAIEGRARAAASGDKPIDSLRRELADLAKLDAQIDAARRAHYAKADLEFFAETSAVHQQLAKIGAEPTPDQALELLRAWPAEIAEPRFIREPIGEVWAGRAVQDEVAAAAADMQRLEAKRQPGDEARLDPMNQHLRESQQQLAVLQKKLEAPKRREYDAIRADARGLLAGLDKLKAEIADLKELRLQEFEAYLPKFRARQLDSGSGALDAEFIRARDSIDRAHAQSKDIGELRDRADRVARVLKQLDALPKVEGLSGPSAQIAQAEREAALAEAIAQLPRDEESLPTAEAVSSAAFTEYWSKRTAAYEAWLAEARAALVEADAIGNLIADGYGPAHDDGSGPLADRWARLARQPAFAKLLEQQEPLRAIGRRLDAMRQISASNDPAALAQVLETPATPLAEAVAAWSRLRGIGNPGAPSWPGTVADLRRASAILTARLGPLAASARSEARRAELAAWVKDQSIRAWAGGFEALKPDAAEIDAAIAMAPEFGVAEADIAGLSPASRFNLLLSRLRAELAAASPPPDDEAVRARLRKFDADVSGLGVADPAAAGLAGALRDLVNAPPKKEVDLATVGPGSVGWAKSDAAPDGSWVVYSAPAANVPPLRFWRVTDGQSAGGAPAAYLCEVETSLAMFAGIVEAAKGSEDVLKLLARFDADPDPRKGPSAWSLVRKDARGPSRPPVELRTPEARRVGQGWLNVVAGMDRGEAYYPAGLQVPPPTADCPMNYLPATAAVYTARLAGCRLPTPAEWRAAAGMNQPGTPNVRDKSWKDQHAFIVAQREGGKVNAPWPDEDIFVPEERKAEISARRRRTALPVTDQDADHALWFLPVSQAGHGDPFKHLRGNVAEILFENSARLDGLSPAGVLSNSDWTGLKIAGGSALSPVEVGPDTVYNAPSGNAYFSDVGFRLAFSAGEGKPKPLITQAGQVLASARYLDGSRRAGP
ncbi:MAG: hypothetical protein IT436_18230 [Phycisphaerales bacterium]|nr:hypothetical protein [Phycisphaerales bacterium]